MNHSATEAGIYLHHLAIESSQPQRLAEFYSTVMDMSLDQPKPGIWRCHGNKRRVLFTEGADKVLQFAGFSCRSSSALDQFRQHLSATGIALQPSPSPWFGDDAFAVSDPDGNVICFGMAGPETGPDDGLPGPIQHLTFASLDVEAFQDFYHGTLGFDVTDRVGYDDGSLATCFTTANHEHHSIACFKSHRQGMDHHSYEAGEWAYIRDWCDHFAAHNVQLMWGPGRHGPGNNLFVFIEDPDGNWIEVSAELETIYGRPVKEWPQAERTLNLWGKAIMRS